MAENTVTIRLTEYKALKAYERKEEKEVGAVRTQMKIQQQQARKLAEAVLQAFTKDGNVNDGKEVMNALSAQTAIKIANDVLFCGNLN